MVVYESEPLLCENGFFALILLCVFGVVPWLFEVVVFVTDVEEAGDLLEAGEFVGIDLCE